MKSIEPEQILFTDNDGNKSSLEDIIDEGLDGEYQERIPHLTELLHSGSPLHKLLACVVLTSWGRHEGFETIILWSSNPKEVPWMEAPVSYDRFYGVDDAFEKMAEALKTSYWNESNDELIKMQRNAAASLLEIYTHYYFDRTLALALLKDSIWQTSWKDEVAEKIRLCISQIEKGEHSDFDLSFQTASLLFLLAAVDDRLTAQFAQQLMTLCNTNTRTLKEIIAALATADGAETLKILQKLSESNIPSISEDATREIQRKT